jgi:hypothetical protein
VLLPLRRCHRPLCKPRVVGGVWEGVSWMATASSRRQLGGTVSLREHLNPTGRPLSSRCLWSSQSTRDGSPSGRPRLRLHRRCDRQRLACTLCRVVEVRHHRVLLLLPRLGPDGQGSQYRLRSIFSGGKDRLEKPVQLNG